MRDEDMTVDDGHRAANAGYATASAEYEAAVMAGDPAVVVAARARLTAASRLYADTLAAVVRDRAGGAPPPSPNSALRRSLPTFEEMLAHPWSQPPGGDFAIGGVVYGAAIPQSAGLQVGAVAAVGSGSMAPAPPAMVWSDVARAVYDELFADTSSKELVPS